MASNPEIDQLLSDSTFRERVAVLVRYAVHNRALPSSAVDDISQQVLINLSKLSVEKFKSIDNLPSYIGRMALNEAIKHRLRAKIDFDEQLEETEDRLPYSDKSAGARELEFSLLLKEISESLTDNERYLLELMIIGFTEKEIARLLHISHDSARQRVVRLRRKLRELIFES